MGSWSDRTDALIRKRPHRSLPPPPPLCTEKWPHEDTRSRWLQARKRSCIRKQPWVPLILVVQPSELWESKEVTSSVAFYYVSPSWLRQSLIKFFFLPEIDKSWWHYHSHLRGLLPNHFLSHQFLMCSRNKN